PTPLPFGLADRGGAPRRSLLQLLRELQPALLERATHSDTSGPRGIDHLCLAAGGWRWRRVATGAWPDQAALQRRQHERRSNAIAAPGGEPLALRRGRPQRVEQVGLRLRSARLHRTL